MATTPTPAPATPPAAPESKLPFWQYLTSQIPNHLIVIAILVAIGGLVFGINYVLDLKKQLETQQQVTATLQQQQQIFKNGAAVAQNTQASQSSVESQAQSSFGSDVIDYMKQQGATIQSLTSVIGQTQAAVTALQAQQLPKYTPQTESPKTGALSGYPLVEQRTGAPPLSQVNLSYDPTQTDPATAFKGTTWDHYHEDFTASFGDWQKQSDGGFKTSVALKRTVTGPDPKDPSKTVTLGTEDIPVTGATTIFTPKGITAGAPVVIPRWTASIGVSASSGSYSPAASIDYRVTDKFGVFVGTANKAAVGGISIRLGAQ